MTHVLRGALGLILSSLAVGTLSSCTSANAQSSEPSDTAAVESVDFATAAAVESASIRSRVDFGDAYRGTIVHALAKSAASLPVPLYVDATLGQKIRLLGEVEFRQDSSVRDFVELCARCLGGDCVVDFSNDSVAIVRACPARSSVVDPRAIRLDFGDVEVFDLSAEMERCAVLSGVRVLVDTQIFAGIQGRPPAGIRGNVVLAQALEDAMASAGLDVEIVAVDGALRVRPKR